ncbi:MAG: HAMP domain-containing sensor histidine kinase [Chloroflexota bacterium]
MTSLNKIWIRLSFVFLFVLAILIASPATFYTVNGLQTPLDALPEVVPDISPENLIAIENYVMNQMRLAVRTMSVVLIIGAVIGITIGVVASRSLTRPLDRLRQAAERIEQNDFSIRVEPQGTDEIKELARSFNNMAEQLETAEELRKNLLSDVAHELRNPLHIVKGNIEAMLDGVFEKNETHLLRVLRQTQLVVKLVEDLDEIARAEAKQLKLNLRSVNLGKLISDVTQSFEHSAQTKNIDLVVDIPSTLPMIEADSDRIKQIMLNLVSNAFRYTSEGGEILIAAEQTQEGIYVRVKDNGVGINSADLPHIFDRFYRTDKARSRAKGGTGLGLAIAKALVEMHQGSIHVTSPGVGKGSTFSFTLPSAA